MQASLEAEQVYHAEYKRDSCHIFPQRKKEPGTSLASVVIDDNRARHLICTSHCDALELQPWHCQGF